MNAVERSSYVEAFDEVLLPLGYKRPKRAQEWSMPVGASSCLWVHLNFGLAVINPSLGVRYTDLVSTLPPEAGAVVGSIRMLSSLSGARYSSDTPPPQLVGDLLAHGLSELTALQNRQNVIRQLEDPAGVGWPVASASHRKRLLPLLLASQGRVNEALEWLARFEPLPDQLVPGYLVYARVFRCTYRA
jgi:hypothetical protein